MQEKLNHLVSAHAAHVKCTSTCHQDIAHARQELCKVKNAVHPGFVISFDKLDLQLQRKSMSMESQNRDFHWVNHQMVENRVSGVLLDAKQQKADLNDIPNLKFLPDVEDQQRQRLNYMILTSRILVDYFSVLEPLKDVCIQHIPHKYTKEISEKSKKVGFNTLFADVC